MPIIIDIRRYMADPAILTEARASSPKYLPTIYTSAKLYFILEIGNSKHDFGGLPENMRKKYAICTKIEIKK